ncbi:hypothetical protein ACI789_05675 [Geodermatophilus sp. SYSU D00965]
MALPGRTWRRLVAGTAAAALSLGLTATSAQAATPDAPGSYRSVTTTTPQNTWTPGTMSSVKDVDTYRFTTTTARSARILLGDLRADYRMRLLDSAGRVLATSDRGGLANEEIYRALPAGKYFVAVDAPHGKVSASAYALRFTSLDSGLVLLSQRVRGSGAARVVDVEVLNNTSRPVRTLHWWFTPATPCDPVLSGSCNGGWGRDVYIPARGRATFTATEAPTSSSRVAVDADWTSGTSPKVSVAITRTTSTSVTGTWTNGSSSRLCFPTPVRTSYDARGAVLAAHEVWLAAGPWAAGRTSTWSATKVPAPPSGTVRTAWSITTGPPPPLGC